MSRLAIGLLALLSATLWAVLAYSPDAPLDYQSYQQVERISRDGAALSPPVADQSAQLTLPTRWQGPAAVQWFGLNYDLKQLQDRAIFVPRVGNRMELWLNGEFVARWGERGVAAYNQGKHPLWQPLNTKLLRLGDNQIILRVESDTGKAAGLSEVYVGAYTDISRLHQGQWLAEIGSSIAALVACVLLGVLGLAFGLRTGNRNFNLFGIAALAWSLRGAPALFAAGDDAGPMLMQLSDLGYGVFVGCIQLFAFRQMGVYEGWVRWSVRGVLGLTALLVPLAHLWPVRLTWLLDIWHGSLLLSAALAVPVVLRQALRVRSLLNMILLTAALVCLVFGLHDFFLIQLSDAGFGRVSLTRFAAVVFVVAMVMILLEKHLQALNLSASMNQRLTQRVADRELELQAIYDQQATVQQQEVLRQERERLTRDMHDGMGMHLQVLQAMLRKPDPQTQDLSATLQNAIDQLRLTVDALSPVAQDLPGILAQLRYRLDDRLVGSGIKLRWNVDEFPAQAQLHPDQTVQWQYLLFEIFANVLKHANARHLHVRASYHDGKSPVQQLEIQDDGCGFAPDSTASGRGLKHIAARAKTLGATLRIDSAPGQGTRITLGF